MRDPAADVVEIEDLRVHILRGYDAARRHNPVRALNGISLTVRQGEVVGLVGESGSGKTMTGLSIIKLLPSGATFLSGRIRIEGRDVVPLEDREMRRIRGRKVGVVFQDPMTSLTPTMTVGQQVAETVRIHHSLSRRDAWERAAELLSLVRVPGVRERLSDYPHQLSGGLRQRVALAIALAGQPGLLIADEPTTALDVTIQAQILDLIDDLRLRLRMAVLLITHDFGVIAGRADRVAVMRAGTIVEEAATRALFRAPRRASTRALLASIRPPVAGRQDMVAEGGCSAAEEPAAPLVVVQHLVKEFPVRGGGALRRRALRVQAVSDVSFTVSRRETFGIVGESGCGKTTLARIIVGLERPTSGGVAVDGVGVGSLAGAEGRRQRPRRQLVFQDPYSSLDPRMRVRDIVRQPLVVQRRGSKPEQLERVHQLLREVGLDPETVGGRHPHGLSGGERQRVALARALALNPTLLVADEPVSALDASIRNHILRLMAGLQRTHGLTYIVISHDLSMVRQISDRIGVMYLGKLVEVGGAELIYRRPRHPYTAGLIEAIPLPDPDAARSGRRDPAMGELASPIYPPSGCRYRTRCPRAEPVCAAEEPALRQIAPGQLIACHFPLEGA